MLNLRELQKPLKEKYKQNPTSARLTTVAQSAPSDLANPMVCRIAVEGHTFEVGASPAVGGSADYACPGDMLLAALAACQEITLRMVAAAMGIELESVQVKATGEWDARGTLAIDRAVPIGYTRVHCETRVRVKGHKSEGDPERTRRLLENAEKYCVVLSTLRNAPEVTSQFVLE